MPSEQDIKPSYFGFVDNRDDAMILIQACLEGSLRSVQRRPSSSEQPSIAESGHVFVYERNVSGIQRWTDGRKWSPSRVLGEFFIYGEQSASAEQSHIPPDGNPPRMGKEDSEGWNRSLYGPLTGSLRVSAQSLVKKIIKVQPCDDSDATWHVVSYYRSVDVVQGLLPTPSMNKGCILAPWNPQRNSIPFAVQSDAPSTRLCSMSLPMRLQDSSPSAGYHVQPSWPLWRGFGQDHTRARQDPIPDLDMVYNGALPWHDHQWDPSLRGHGVVIPDKGTIRSRPRTDLNGQATVVGRPAYVDGSWR